MPERRPKGFVSLGGVAKPHGIRGEFCIRSYADSPSIFLDVPALYLQEGGRPPKAFTVRSAREHKEFVLLTLDGVTDRDQAEALRGRTVLVREDDLPQLEEGEHYLYQMMGSRVVLEDGTEIGTLEHFYENAAQDTWVIVDGKEREILLPAVPEFVLDVDLDSGTIVIAPPEGLLDLYLNPEAHAKSQDAPEPTADGDKKRRRKPAKKRS
ncbi:ribosome maturation factor RimM [Pseudodesulfovibrio sp.]|uniref:ribosome maturation factor RimM n=1 Tax=unclassified Pseudodesulfovibrio TaxID=2661612 RepID=UPI003B0075D8